MKTLLLIAICLIVLNGCSKMEEKKTTQKPSEDQSGQTPMTQKPDGTSGNENKSSGASDEKAALLVTEADNTLAKYKDNTGEEARKEIVTKCMEAANYLMLEAELPAKEKYRPALKYYRKVLEIDPKNEEAAKNKKQIEDIYVQMGLPIPQ